MSPDVLRLVLVVAAGWAVTFALRALPFVFFSGSGRLPPARAERFGAVVSPIVIAALVVYSYSGLAWTTVYPYAAGALTVGLQLWRRNPLVSIFAGTALYMALVSCCGCRSAEPLVFDGDHPCIAVTDRGIRFVDRFVTPQEVPRLLEKHAVPKTETIPILLEDPDADPRALWVFRHNILGRAGYTRSITVTRRKATSAAGEEARKETRRRGERTVPFRSRPPVR